MKKTKLTPQQNNTPNKIYQNQLPITNKAKLPNDQ